MTDPTEIMKPQILLYDFLYSEIIKRHVEEYDPETIKFLKLAKDQLIPHDFIEESRDNLFSTVVSQAIDIYEAETLGFHPYKYPIVLDMIKRLPDIFNFSKYKNLYDELLRISIKYDIHAPELLDPLDLYEIPLKFNNEYLPPCTYRFKRIKNDKFYSINYGCTPIVLTKKDTELNEDDVDFLKKEFLTFRLMNNEQLTTLEGDILNKNKDFANNSKFRKDSFINKIIGICAWDEYKLNGNIDKVYDLYKKYQKINNKCKDMVCDLTTSNMKDSGYCSNFEACKKFIRDSRRSVSIDIKEGKINQQKVKGDAITPTNKINLSRLSLETLNIGIE